MLVHGDSSTGHSRKTWPHNDGGTGRVIIHGLLWLGRGLYVGSMLTRTLVASRALAALGLLDAYERVPPRTLQTRFTVAFDEIHAGLCVEGKANVRVLAVGACALFTQKVKTYSKPLFRDNV